MKVRTPRKIKQFLVKSRSLVWVSARAVVALLRSFWPNSNKFMTAPRFLFEKFNKKFLNQPPVCFLTTLGFMRFRRTTRLRLCYTRAVSKSEHLPLASANAECKQSVNSAVCKHELCYRPAVGRQHAATRKQQRLLVISEPTDDSWRAPTLQRQTGKTDTAEQPGTASRTVWIRKRANVFWLARGNVSKAKKKKLIGKLWEWKLWGWNTVEVPINSLSWS